MTTGSSCHILVVVHTHILVPSVSSMWPKVVRTNVKTVRTVLRLLMCKAYCRIRYSISYIPYLFKATKELTQVKYSSEA